MKRPTPTYDFLTSQKNRLINILEHLEQEKPYNKEIELQKIWEIKILQKALENTQAAINQICCTYAFLDVVRDLTPRNK